jgi:hypothetical protein
LANPKDRLRIQTSGFDAGVSGYLKSYHYWYAPEAQ